MYQVFEKTADGKRKIHDFKTKKEALKKKKELEKAGTLDGDIWDSLNNPLSNMFKFR